MKTKEELAEIQSRIEKTSPAPWTASWSGQQFSVIAADGEEILEQTYVIHTWEPDYTEEKLECDTGNAEFIAYARQDMQDLLDMIEELQTQPPTVIRCKHCGMPISGYTHIHTGLGRCNPQNSNLPYGYNAEPIGTECSNPCLGSSA